MTTGYQEQLAALLDGLQLPLEPDIDLRVKPFFGGAAAYANGRICLTLSPAGFALKLPHGERSTLTEQGATPLRYFPKAPVKKQYVVLPDTMVRDRDSLRNWVGIAIRHVTDNSQ